MNFEQGFWKKSLGYDVILSILYTWAIYQVYVFEAKEQVGMTVFIVIYLAFTLLVRSPFGALLMNVLSGLSLFWIMGLPVIKEAATYFKLGTFFGLLLTFGVLCIQVILANALIIWGRKFLELRHQYLVSFGIAVILTVVVTVLAS